jgi:putative ABC transport system permease protein
VTSQNTTYVDIVRGMSGQNLDRVRSIPGVAWAQPFLSARALAELPDGNFTAVEVVGVERTTLIGQPPQVLEGQLANLRAPNTVLLETSQRDRLPGIGTGDRLRLNDRQVHVVGICRAKTGIFSRPLLFTTYDNATRYVPLGRKPMTWILVKAGLNFLCTIVLGSLVGLVVSTAAFNQFTSDNMPHYATLKAIGTPSSQLIRVVVLQGVTAGVISYGIGLGLASVASLPGRSPDAQLTAQYPWQLLVAALVPMLVCVAAGSIVSLWRVMRLDPVVVFQS